MNPIERQSRVSRELYDINLDTMQQLLGIAGEGIERYFTINADYVAKLADRPGPMQFLELQRNYGEALVAGLQYDVERGGRILSEAVQKSSSALMGGWSGAAEDARELTKTAESASEAMADQAGSMTEALTEQAGSVTETLAEQAESVTEGLTEKAASVAEQAVETAANAADVVTRAIEQPDRHLEGNPELEGSLERVHGIGRAMARQLREAGVETLAQLAAIDVEELSRQDHPLHPFRARIEADHWIDQARSLIDPQRH